MTDTSIAEIYNSIVGGFFLTYKEEVKGLIEQIVPTSVYCFNELCKLLLPIPTKPH
jgi:dynein heavy chain